MSVTGIQIMITLYITAISFAIDCLKMVEANYPERLKKCYVINGKIQTVSERLLIQGSLMNAMRDEFALDNKLTSQLICIHI